MPRPRKPRMQFGYAPRTWGRFVLLIVMAALLVMLAVRVRDPRGWAWLGAGHHPEQQPAAQAPKRQGERLSIDPDREKLRGAADRMPFLVENPRALLHDDSWQQQRRDADARYELLLYAKTCQPGSLIADARRDLRFVDLIGRPADLRGEIIYIQGDLLWIKKMELHRSGFGISSCYQGLLVVRHPDEAYWLLFTELPTGYSEETSAVTLFRPNVSFAGYFYKILAAEPPSGSQSPRYLPVLIGRSPVMPPSSSVGNDFAMLGMVFLLAVLPVALIGCLALWWYRSNDKAIRSKMLEVRERQEARDAQALSTLDAQVQQGAQTNRMTN